MVAKTLVHHFLSVILSFHVVNCGIPVGVKRTFEAKSLTTSVPVKYNLKDVLQFGAPSIVGICQQVVEASGQTSDAKANGGVVQPNPNPERIFKTAVDTTQDGTNWTEEGKLDLENEFQAFEFMKNIAKYVTQKYASMSPVIPIPEIVFYDEISIFENPKKEQYRKITFTNSKQVTVSRFVFLEETGKNMSMGMEYLGKDVGKHFESLPDDFDVRMLFALELAAQLMRILDIFEDAGFVHRDWKPANLAMGKPNTPKANVVHVIDPAFAKFKGSPRTEHINCGSPLYMCKRILLALQNPDETVVVPSTLDDVFAFSIMTIQQITNMAPLPCEANETDWKTQMDKFIAEREPNVLKQHLEEYFEYYNRGAEFQWLVDAVIEIYKFSNDSNPGEKIDLLGKFVPLFESKITEFKKALESKQKTHS